MWGKTPFWILDNCVIEMRNLGTARDWYKKTLRLREAAGEREDDSGRPFVDRCVLTMTRPLRWSNERRPHPRNANI